MFANRGQNKDTVLKEWKNIKQTLSLVNGVTHKNLRAEQVNSQA